MTLNCPRPFGLLSDNREVTEYCLTNQSGFVVKVLNYGGIIRSIEAPDRTGQMADIVLGFDTLRDYEAQHPYFGAIIGRVAGRIGGGCLPVNGTIYQLPINNSPNHLHGGIAGFDHRLFDAEYSPDSRSLTLSYVSPSGEEGYPGQLGLQVTYRLTDSDDLIVDYSATADSTTVVNPTQHSYFNLSGDPSKTIFDHELTVWSDKVLDLDENAIPTGDEIDVTGSRLDFRTAKTIGSACKSGHSNSNIVGLDNFWVLPSDDGQPSRRMAAELFHPDSGRLLQVETTAPGVQIYSGAHLPVNTVGKQEEIYGPSAGVCFETQVHPDSPNQADFPSICLEPEDTFQSTTVFRIRVS